ncbi:MAG: hypothetical protein GXX79_15050 [Actinomycetales bacterium]|nr:hypothetical protein [Actinomycetales bacterium]
MTGDVTKLGVRSSLSYFSPGCGAGEDAVFTQERLDDPEDPVATRLFTVDAARGELGSPVEVAGQVTSAVPVGSAVVAARGRHVVRVERSGRVRALAAGSGAVARLVPDADGGVVFVDQDAKRARVRRLSGVGADRKVTELVEGAAGAVSVVPGRGGRAFVTGTGTAKGSLPQRVRRLDVPVGSEVSGLGRLAIVPQPRTGAPTSAKQAANPAEQWLESTARSVAGDEAAPVRLRTRAMATGKQVEFSFTPGVRAARRIGEGARAHPLLVTAPEQSAAGGTRSGQAADGLRVMPRVSRAGSRVGAAAGAVGLRAASESTTPVDAAATCAVSRNDVGSQVYQPTMRQVEWAADQAVVGNLTMTRPANWKYSGMPSYSPQGLFPLKTVQGPNGPGRVPVQILLGILAQESNLWQASNHAAPGETGNPLVGNFYGRDTSISLEELIDGKTEWDIDFADADCGYGVTQITDGMRKLMYGRLLPDGSREIALSPDRQRAVALDYTANIAAGLNILIDKWNQTRAAGLVHSDGDPGNIENWFFAAWAYNSGFYPQSEASKNDGAWGVGWFNNPANPRYPFDRHAFGSNPHDAAHPQDWPYPEKVIGFAGYGLASPYEGSFRAAWWGTDLGYSRRSD